MEVLQIEWNNPHMESSNNIYLKLSQDPLASA
jgi:hypothetical protein